MNKSLLENMDLNFDQVAEKVKETILTLFNMIEALAKENTDLRQDNQHLRDEINRLKGEHGKPNIKPNPNISSEKERKNKEKTVHKKRPKNQHLKIDRTEICEVDKSQLPGDAEFKGYKAVIVQGLKIQRDNVKFKKEIYYSASAKKTYIAELPPEYEGGFSPGIKALTLIFKNVCNMSESKIFNFFRYAEVDISAGTISNMLIKDKDEFHQEKQELVTAGLESTELQQTDDTNSRVNGQNCHTHILSNPYYTAFTTTEKKNRLSVIAVLQNGNPLRFCLNGQAFDILEQLKTGGKYRPLLEVFASEELYAQDEFEALISPVLNQTAVSVVMEAAAIAAYRKGEGHPVIDRLLCDDAPQFKLICRLLALCWVHDGRHYKKLCPALKYNAQKVTKFITQFWAYYDKLLAYKNSPSPERADELSAEFDRLFSTATGYNDLDQRILKTRAKKDELLLVLKYPEIPLHNNAAELAARVIARKRDVSLHTMTKEGTKANDTFLSIVETCKKLGVNPFEYLFDRISKKYQLPSLAEMIRSISKNNLSLAID
jgi:regulator of replication initiation timing